jgi:lipoic acid synthetase
MDEGEPGRVVEAARSLGLRYVVVTSVTRDDLPDGGAEQFARVVREMHERLGARVEVLTPDFGGRRESVATVVASRPDVYNHNLETVPRLYAEVRPGASYERSLGVLAEVKRLAPGMVTKSGLMLGLGEERGEVRGALADLRAVGCGAVTLGQYLAPSPEHLPVARFIPPGEFAELAVEARGLGFRAVAAGPFVRSSHGAAELFTRLGAERAVTSACAGGGVVEEADAR